MVIVRVGQKHIADFVWVDAVLPQLLHTAREAARISSIDQDIADLCGNQVVIDHTGTKIDDGHIFPPAISSQQIVQLISTRTASSGEK